MIDYVLMLLVKSFFFSAAAVWPISVFILILTTLYRRHRFFVVAISFLVSVFFANMERSSEIGVNYNDGVLGFIDMSVATTLWVVAANLLSFRSLNRHLSPRNLKEVPDAAEVRKWQAVINERLPSDMPESMKGEITYWANLAVGAAKAGDKGEWVRLKRETLHEVDTQLKELKRIRRVQRRPLQALRLCFAGVVIISSAYLLSERLNSRGIVQKDGDLYLVIKQGEWVQFEGYRGGIKLKTKWFFLTGLLIGLYGGYSYIVHIADNKTAFPRRP